MRIRQFDYFLTAAELLNFARAARVHYLTQQTFVNQIRSLEKEVGAPLFVRNDEGWALTEAGRVLRDRLPRVRAEIDGMLEEVRQASRGYEGTLTVVSLEGLVLGERYMSAMTRLHEENPTLGIVAQRLSYGGIREALDADVCDAAVTVGCDVARRTDIGQISLARARAVLAMPSNHPLACRETLTVANLDGLDLFMPGDLSLDPNELLAEVHAQGVRPHLIACRNSSTAVLSVEMGLGATLHFGDTILAGNNYVALRPIAGLSDYEIVLCWKRDNMKPALARFVELLGDN